MKRVRLRTALEKLLAAIVLVLTAGLVFAMVLLWPASEPVQYWDNDGEGSEIISATVTDILMVSCEDPNTGYFGQSAPGSDICFEGIAEAILPGSDTATEVTFLLNGVNELTQQYSPLSSGDQIMLVQFEQINELGVTETLYGFYDVDRGIPLLIIVLLFIVIVVVIGRWKGLLSLVGVGFAAVLFGFFILPAILTAQSPILVASVGSALIMLIVLYLAHGISLRTTSALLGSFFGILFTAIVGSFAADSSHITGIAEMSDGALQLALGGLNVSHIFTATIIVAGLGVLNDITVSQASAVTELWEISPQSSPTTIFSAAMRIGRDHIASSIYTLVFAYAGAAMMTLLVLYTYPGNIVDLLNTEMISQEIVRTLVGVAGLVLAMPVTTFIAVFFATENARQLEQRKPDSSNPL